MSLVMDLRCLQDPIHAERGIPGHARTLLRHAPVPVVGLYDPALAPLPVDILPLVSELSPHAYIPGATSFLNPSPFTHHQDFAARLLTNPRIRKAVCVHDFIPYDEPERYLGRMVDRLDYFSAMVWLKRYDVYLPNSVPTEARLRALYGNVPSVVTGVALGGFALGVTPQEPRHILMVGGDDERKNPEVLLRAYALSPALRRFKLVIVGGYGAATRARLAPAELPGRVSDAALRELYAQAALVVTPSRAEGFSLPVLEACAASVPSIASDIPPHRALLGAGYVFPPDDAAALAALAEDVLARREEVVRAQSGLWQPYTADQVAARVFNALLGALAVVRRAKPRIAVLSPMPPERSGVADYTAATLPALRALAEVEVFSGPRIGPLPYADARYDAVLSVIGNSPLHTRIYEFARQRGSAVLCHDSRLMGLLADRAPELASAELGRVVQRREVAGWFRDETRREASFLGELAGVARPLIFHAQPSVDLVQARFGVQARHLRFAVQRVFDPVPKAQARAALGLDLDEKLVVSYGFAGWSKAIPVALAGFALLRQRVKARLVFAGECVSDFGRAPDGVVLGTGFLPEAQYRLWLSAADVALQLREGPGGAISGALQDAIVAGRPGVATADLADNIEAPDYVRRVENTPEEIAAALEAVLAEPGATEEARQAFIASYSMAEYAQNLLNLLEL